MVAAAISSTDPEISKDMASKDEQTRRPQMLSSAKDNNNEVEDNHKRPKSRVVSSRHTSPSNSACIASSPSRKHCAPLGTKHSAATKLLVTSSRSLSVSFQGESYLSPISKPRIDPNLRIGTLDKRKTNTTTLHQAEASNLKPSGDQYRWPARQRTLNTLSMIKERNPSVNVLSSLDLGDPSTRLDITTKFWQEMNSRLRRLHDPDLSTSPVSKSIASTKSRRSNNYAPLSTSRTMSSPLMVMGHSLYKVRNDVSPISNKRSETSSFHSFGVEKVGENRNDDAKFLRLLYNRHLQWRFVNARSEALLVVQKHRAQKNLWNAWITISDLRDTVTKRRHRVQLLKQKLKLTSILKGQMAYLENWTSLDKHHFISLLGCIEALKASTLQLPVLGGAIADVRSLKNAICPAVDITQSIALSVRLLLPTVQKMNSLMTELVAVTAKERALLKQCTDFVHILEAMQVKESRLRTHLLLLHNKVTTA